MLTAWRRQMGAQRPEDVRAEALMEAFVGAAGWEDDVVTPSMLARLRSFAADLPPGATPADVERAVELFPAVCHGVTLSPGNVRDRWSELNAWAKVLAKGASR